MAKAAKDSCLLPFHFLQQASLVAGVFYAVCNPLGLSQRALTEADAWTHYRLKSLKFRIHPNGVRTASLAVGYCGGIQDTFPATTVAVSELLPSAIIGIQATTPTNWVKPSKSELSGCFPWYKTIQGTADSTEESPGVLCYCGNSTDPVCVEIVGVFEFKGAVATANTPSALKLREELRALRLARIDSVERERLLSVLGKTSTTK